MPREVRSPVVALLVSAALVLVAVPIAWFSWLAIKGIEAASRSATFLEAWQAGDYDLIEDLLAEDCFQTADDLHAILGDSEISEIRVSRRIYSFGTVARGSILIDENNVQNFEFNAEADKLCGPLLWDPQE